MIYHLTSRVAIALAWSMGVESQLSHCPTGRLPRNPNVQLRPLCALEWFFAILAEPACVRHLSDKFPGCVYAVCDSNRCIAATRHGRREAKTKLHAKAVPIRKAPVDLHNLSASQDWTGQSHARHTSMDSGGWRHEEDTGQVPKNGQQSQQPEVPKSHTHLRDTFPSTC